MFKPFREVLSLKISSRAARGPNLEKTESYRFYWWYWGHSELRDDRVALFADWINHGTYEYTYLLRAGIAGTFHALPTRAYAMYDPSILGQSAGSTFTITP